MVALRNIDLAAAIQPGRGYRINLLAIDIRPRAQGPAIPPAKLCPDCQKTSGKNGRRARSASVERHGFPHVCLHRWVDFLCAIRSRRSATYALCSASAGMSDHLPALPTRVACGTSAGRRPEASGVKLSTRHDGGATCVRSAARTPRAPGGPPVKR